eukprot:767802-Hanusia_phi.AAC.2
MDAKEPPPPPSPVYVCKNGIIQSDLSMGMPPVILAENNANGIYIDELDGNWDKFPPATYVIENTKKDTGTAELEGGERSDFPASEQEGSKDEPRKEMGTEAAHRPDHPKDEPAAATDMAEDSSQDKSMAAGQGAVEASKSPRAGSETASSKRAAPDQASPGGEEGQEEEVGKRAKSQEVQSDARSAQNSDNDSSKSNNNRNKSGVSLRPRRSNQKSITYMAHGLKAGTLKHGHRKREPDKLKDETNKIAEDLLELSDRIPYSAVWQVSRGGALACKRS